MQNATPEVTARETPKQAESGFRAHIFATRLALAGLAGGSLGSGILSLFTEGSTAQAAKQDCVVNIQELRSYAFRNTEGDPDWERDDNVIGIPEGRLFFITGGRNTIISQINNNGLAEEVVNRKADPSKTSFELKGPCDDEATRIRGVDAMTVTVKDQDNGDESIYQFKDRTQRHLWEMVNIDRIKDPSKIEPLNSQPVFPPANAEKATRVSGATGQRQVPVTGTPAPASTRINLTPAASSPTPDIRVTPRGTADTRVGSTPVSTVDSKPSIVPSVVITSVVTASPEANIAGTAAATTIAGLANELTQVRGTITTVTAENRRLQEQKSLEWLHNPVFDAVADHPVWSTIFALGLFYAGGVLRRHNQHLGWKHTAWAGRRRIFW